jgi:hypothetical protein
MAEIIHPESIAPTIPADDYFSPEARRLCARVLEENKARSLRQRLER